METSKVGRKRRKFSGRQRGDDGVLPADKGAKNFDTGLQGLVGRQHITMVDAVPSGNSSDKETSATSDTVAGCGDLLDDDQYALPSFFPYSSPGHLLCPCFLPPNLQTSALASAGNF